MNEQRQREVLFDILSRRAGKLRRKIQDGLSELTILNMHNRCTYNLLKEMELTEKEMNDIDVQILFDDMENVTEDDELVNSLVEIVQQQYELGGKQDGRDAKATIGVLLERLDNEMYVKFKAKC